MFTSALPSYDSPKAPFHLARGYDTQSDKDTYSEQPYSVSDRIHMKLAYFPPKQL